MSMEFGYLYSCDICGATLFVGGLKHSRNDDEIPDGWSHVAGKYGHLCPECADRIANLREEVRVCR